MMAMVFEFNIRPFGYQNSPIQFGKMQIHSAGSHHEYKVEYKTKDGWATLRGIVPKARSGHRNFLHLLVAILDDIDLDKLDHNYVNVLEEIETAYPHVKSTRIGDYADEPNSPS
jgi:hypothetical protein